ncbi:hypothetical protein HanPI659440_Chr04g0178111 [Helianthus annuus]|nr:hypothetical protein HanPI659440_Chr04g0178111 [Helianthus annuus]
MQPFNRSFIPPRSSADPNQSSNPTRPVSSVPTRPAPYGPDFVDFNRYNTGFMNLFEPTTLMGSESIRLEPESKHGRNGVVSSIRIGTSIRLPTTRARGCSGNTTGSRGDAKRKNAHIKRNRNHPNEKNVQSWDAEEEYVLTRAWINVSKDPQIANNQSKAVFWSRIRELFSRLIGRGDEYRPANLISGKWTDINKKCTNFQ